MINHHDVFPQSSSSTSSTSSVFSTWLWHSLKQMIIMTKIFWYTLYTTVWPIFCVFVLQSCFIDWLTPPMMIIIIRQIDWSFLITNHFFFNSSKRVFIRVMGIITFLSLSSLLITTHDQQMVEVNLEFLRIDMMKMTVNNKFTQMTQWETVINWLEVYIFIVNQQ